MCFDANQTEGQLQWIMIIIVYNGLCIQAYIGDILLPGVTRNEQRKWDTNDIIICIYMNVYIFLYMFIHIYVYT